MPPVYVKDRLAALRGSTLHDSERASLYTNPTPLQGRICSFLRSSSPVATTPERADWQGDALGPAGKSRRDGRGSPLPSAGECGKSAGKFPPFGRKRAGPRQEEGWRSAGAVHLLGRRRNSMRAQILFYARIKIFPCAHRIRSRPDGKCRHTAGPRMPLGKRVAGREGMVGLCEGATRCIVRKRGVYRERGGGVPWRGWFGCGASPGPPRRQPGWTIPKSESVGSSGT